jgi:3-deoxy-D-manno-octulosonate 8-phosphate phosphatase (KDO 8-P phosphatase)
MPDRDGIVSKAARIRVLILDVDGVMTDGRIILGDGGMEFKCFDVKDGHGIKLAQRVGLEIAFVTGRSSEAVEHRARELGVAQVRQGVARKAEAVDAILEALSLSPSQAAFMGDDLIDLPAMRRCGLAVAVADAHPEVIDRADLVTTHPGGRGAVREVIEIVLKARGDWEKATERYLGRGGEETV